MKRKLYLTGMFSIILAFGIMLLGCQPMTGPGGSPDTNLTGTVSITGSVYKDRTLTANITDLRGTGTVSYQWKRADTESGAGTVIPGASASTYIPNEADLGKYLKVSVTREGYTGSVTSSAVGPVFQIIEEGFTAESDLKGVKLKLDISKIPAGTTNIQIRLEDYSSAYVNVGQWSGGFIEFVYPFVEQGKTYVFRTEFEGTAYAAIAEVAAAGGLGKMTLGNTENVRLLYNEETKTMSLNGSPQAPSFSDSGITDNYWMWHFLQGHDWSDDVWKGWMNTNEITPLTIDNTFHSNFHLDPSENFTGEAVFFFIEYIIVFDETEFKVSIPKSESITFPQIPVPAELQGTWLPLRESGFDKVIFTDSSMTLTGMDGEVRRSITVENLTFIPADNTGPYAAEYPSGYLYDGKITEGDGPYEVGMILSEEMEEEDLFIYLNSVKDKFRGFGSEWEKEESEPNDDPKSITITGFPQDFEDETLSFAIFEDLSSIRTAYANAVQVSSGSAIFDLIDEYENPWTGDGEYILAIKIADDFDESEVPTYCYTAGAELTSLDNIVAYDITDDNTIGFNQFKLASEPDAVHGKLTITGLDDYAGYVWANSGTTGQEEPEFILLWAGEDIDMTEMTATAVEISNGSVTLNVWQIINAQEFDFELYSGNHQNISFGVVICNSHDIQFDDPEAESIVAEGFVTVDFSGGIAEGTFEIPNNAPKSITITGMEEFNGKYAGLQIIPFPFEGNTEIISEPSVISGGNATIDLIDLNSDPWTGHGDHYVFLWMIEEVDAEQLIAEYAYIADENIMFEDYDDFADKLNSDSLPRYNITNENTIAFDQFAEIPGAPISEPEPIVGNWITLHPENEEMFALITFTDDGVVTFYQTTTSVVELDEEPEITLIKMEGEYTVEGNEVTLTWEGLTPYVLEYSISGDTLTIEGLFINDEDGDEGPLPPTPVDVVFTATDPKPLMGTWNGTNPNVGENNGDFKFVFFNNTWKKYIYNNDTPPKEHEILRGTFSLAGNTATLTVTEVNTGTRDAPNWLAYEEAEPSFISDLGLTSNTITGTLAGDELTVQGITLTRE